MATESETPEPLSITKREGEEKYLTSMQLDRSVDEYWPGELKKVEGGQNQPPETVECSANTDTMQAAICKGNVGTLEGESFLESPSVSNVASEETCRVSEHHQADETPNQAEKEVSDNETKLQGDKKFEAAEETGSEKNEVVEETKETAPTLKVEGEETSEKQRILDQNIEFAAKRQASTEENPQRIEEAMSGSYKDEERGTKTDENTDSESSKQYLDVIEGTSIQNKEASDHSSDLTVDSLNKDVETVTEACNREESIKNIISTETTLIQEELEEKYFKGGEDTESEKSSNIVDMEKDMEKGPEAISPSEKMKDAKDEGEQIPRDGIRDVSVSTLTENPDIQNDEEAILEIGEGAKDKLDSPPLTLLKVKTPVEDEIQEMNNLDTPFVIETEEMCLQKVEKPDIFKEVSKIGSEDVVKESPKEVEDQTEIPEKTAQADSTTSEKVKDDENPEQNLDGSFIKHEESMQSKGNKLATIKASAGEDINEEKLTVITAEENISNTETVEAEDHGKKETSKHEEDPDQSFMQHDEPKMENLERSLNAISETMEMAASSENAETITCVKGERSIKNLEEGFAEKGKEDKPTDTDYISKHGIPKEKNFPPVDLNEEIESAEVEIPEKNVNDLHVTHSLVEETNQVECEKLDKVSKFEPQEEVNEANGASVEEGKQIEEASEACKSTESTTLEYTSTEEAATQELISSEADPEKLQKIYGLDSEEKLEIKDAEENIEEETQKNEEAFDTEMHQIATQKQLDLGSDGIETSGAGDDTEKGIIEEDAPDMVCSTVGAGETIEQSFQVESLEEAAAELTGDNKSYKAEDDVERNNIIDEKVHDGPKITCMGEITKEHIIEGNVRPSEKIKDEKEEGKQIPYDGIRHVSISTLTENPDIQNDEEAILKIGEGAKDNHDFPPLTLLNDKTPVEDEIQDKNNLDTPFFIKTEEMCLQKVENPEIFKEVSEIGSEDVVKESPKEVEGQTEILEKTAQADSTTIGKSNDDENAEQKLDGLFIKYEESVQSKGEGLATTEASAGDNRNDEIFTVIGAEDKISNTEIVEAEEHEKKETSKNEEDPDQSFLQHDEPKTEKLERSLNAISEMMETSASSENAETIACVKEERFIKTLEEIFEEKGKEDKPTDTDDISEHDISKEKNFPPVGLNKKIESAEVEIPEKNVNDLHVTHSLVEERDQVECEKLDEVPKFEPQEEVNEANGASAEEEKKIEEASEACKSTESTTLDHKSTEGAATKELISSKIHAEKLQKNYGFDSEEKLEAEDDGENIEEETQKNEEAFNTKMHKIATTKSDDTERGIIEEDTPAGVCSTVGAGDETVELSFQVESLEEAAPKLSDDNRSYKAEDDVEENNTIDEEVDDGDKDNITRLVKVKENSEKETSKDDEDAKKIFLQQDEPGEKLERSLNVISEETEEGVSSENADKITCMREEATVQNLEGTLEKEMKEEEAKDTDDTKENGIAKKEDLELVAEASETSKSTESTILELNSKESEIEVEILKKECELDSKEELEGKDASESIEEEIKNEETSYICLHKVETKCAGDETVEQSFQVESLEEAAPELSGDNTSYKAEDDVERNNIIDEEVHDGPKITGTGEATKEHIIKGNIRHISPESIEEETVKSVQDNEKEAEQSKGDDTKEQIIEEVNVVDLSPETVAIDPVKNFQGDEKEAEKFKGEIFEKSETAEAGESIARETNQDDKNPERNFYASSMKQEEMLPTEAPKEEKREEDRSLVMDAGDEDNITRLGKVKEKSETETSKDDEDDKKILQQDEPGEKLEQSLNVMSKETEEGVTSENAVIITCKGEEAAVQNLEEILEKEMKEEAAKDTDDTKEKRIAKEEDLEQVAEASEMSKSPESTVLELNSKESEAEVEKLKKGRELDSKEELEGEDASENIEEEIKKEDTSDLCLHKFETKCAGDETVEQRFQVESLEEAAPESSGDDKSYKAEDDVQRNNIIDEEVHDGHKITGTGEVTKEHFIEDNVRRISLESIEEETVKSFQDNEKKAEKSKTEDTEEQIIDEGNVIDLLPESTAEDPVKNFQDDEKEAEKFKGEIFEESETAEAGESIAHERNQDEKNPKRIFYASSEKQQERLRGEGEDLSPTKAPKEEKIEEDRSSVMDTGDEDNIARLVKIKENSEEETSKDDEDDKQILPQDEPGENLEQSLNVMSKQTEEGVSSENVDKINCEREEVAVHNLEEILEKEMKEEEAKDTDDTKENGIAKEEDLEQVVEASETNKSTESTILELNSKENEIEVEKLKKGCELDSKEELEDKDASENIEEEIKNEETSDLCLHEVETKCAGDEMVEQSCQVESLEEAAPELTGDDKSYKAEDDIQRNNTIDEEVHDGPKITGTGEVTKEHFIEDNVRRTSLESVEEETVKSFQDNEKKAEKSKTEDTEEQIIDEGNVMSKETEEGVSSENADKITCKREEAAVQNLEEILEKEMKEEDDVQRNNIIDEEVHDGPKITGTGEVTKEHFIEHKIRRISLESIEEETVKSFQDNEKKAEKSKTEDTEEQIIDEGNVIDLLPESTAEDPVKNFQDDEKEAEKFKGEIFEESETAEAGETHERNQDDKNPERIFYASSEKQEERLQGEGEDLSPTKAPKEEKIEEDRCSVMDTGDEDNIARLVKIKENSEKKTSKDNEDDKQILPQDEPGEKLEQTLNVMSKETEEGVSSENADKITCKREEAAVQNLEEILEKEMKEAAAKDTDDTKENGITKEEDLEQVTEASETSKITDSTIFELNSKESEIEVEKLKKGCELDSKEELEGKDASENIEEETKNEETFGLCLHKAEAKCAGDETDKQSLQVVILEEAAPELSGDNKSYKVEDDVQRNNIIDEEVHDGPKITTTGEAIKEHIIESDVRYISPESITEETDKIFQENEKEVERSKGEETKEQIIQECNVIDLSPESIAKVPVKNFQDDEKEAEKFKREIFEESEIAKVGESIAHEINQDYESPESIFYASSVKQEELKEGENLCPTKASNEHKRDEDGSSVLVAGDEDNITGLVKAKENAEKETLKDDEDAKQILQQDEPGEKLERSLTVMLEETEDVVSSENAENITCMRQEASVQNLEETSEKEMKEEEKDTQDTKEDGIAKEDLELVSEASDANKRTESSVLELNLKESEIEVEKTKEGCELDSKEKLEGKNASENIEEETKNEETSGLCLHKFETKNASAEKSMIEEDATVKDSSTVCIGEKMVELSCQEDENMQKRTKEAEHKTNGGDQSCKTDNETENLKHQFVNEVYEGPMIARMDEDTDKHIIQEEHTVTDISQEAIGEETSKSFEEDEKEEKKPKVEMCKELQTTSVSEDIEKQNLEEENTIQNCSIKSARVEMKEESSKEDDMVVKMPKQEVCEIIQAANGGENTGKQIMEEDSSVRDDFEVFETTSASQDIREQIIEEIDSVRGHSPESIEKETLGESSKEDEEGEGFKTAPSTTNTEKQNKEESTIPDLSSLSFEEETVKESSKEDENNAVHLKEEIEASGSTEETKLETLKDMTETNKDLGALNTIETSEEEMPPKESNKNLVEHSLVSKMSEKEMKTEILETEEPTINDSDSTSDTVVTEEKCLKGAEPEGKKQNLESSDLGEKLECTSKSLAEDQGDEDQSDKPLPEISQTQIEENNDVHQNTKSVEQKISGQGFQESKKEINDKVESKLEAEDHMKKTQNANETIKDVILTEKVPGEYEKADENENIKEQIMQEESDTKEFHKVSIGDETDNEVKNSDPVSIENLKSTDSKEQIETINLEVEEDLDREQEESPLTKALEKATMEKGGNEKPVDVSISVSEVSEEKIKEEIVEQADTYYDKMDTASVTVVTEEKSLEEPQPDDKHEKASHDSSQEASKEEEILGFGGSNKKANGLPTTHSLGEEISPEVGEKCEEASNIELDKMEKAFESASEVQSHDVLTESEETIKEEHLEAAMTKLRAEENQFEANEIIKNEVSNEEITEQTEIAKESHSVSLSEETIKEIHREDELMAEEHPGEKTNGTFRTTKNGIQNKELSEEIVKTGASENIIKQIAHEDRALSDSYLVSVEDKTITESLPDEAERENDEDAAIKLNLENQGDTTNFRDGKTEAKTQSEEVNMELEKHDLDTLGTNHKKETAITKSEEGPDSNLSVPPETNVAAKEAPHDKVGDKIEKASEPYPKDSVHETNIIYRENKKIATAVAENPESLMEDEKHRHTSLELAWDGTDVKEDLKLKDQEVCDNKPGTSSINENSQEEIPDKNSKFTEDDEKQYDSVFDKTTEAKASITAEGKSIKAERDHVNDEEPIEVSTQGNERKTDEAEIHSTICANEDREIQYQSEKPDDLADIQDSGLVISQKEGSVVFAETNEITQEVQKLEKTSHSISEKQILGEADPIDITETMVSTANKDALRERGNASEIESGLNEETTNKSTSKDTAKISLSNLLQRSTKETLQRDGQVKEEKEPMANKKEMQTEEVETLQEEAAKTDEEKDEEEEGDEHKKADSGSDAPIMVEASRDMDVKVLHKKSHHNILSGVGSKVKHSIAKVKKAITGKSSHPKMQSPK